MCSSSCACHELLDHISRGSVIFLFTDRIIHKVQTTGGDLYEDLKRHGGSIEEERVAARIIQPCMEALAYLHDKVPWRSNMCSIHVSCTVS